MYIRVWWRLFTRIVGFVLNDRESDRNLMNRHVIKQIDRCVGLFEKLGKLWLHPGVFQSCVYQRVIRWFDYKFSDQSGILYGITERGRGRRAPKLWWSIVLWTLRASVEYSAAMFGIAHQPLKCALFASCGHLSALNVLFANHLRPCCLRGTTVSEIW